MPFKYDWSLEQQEIICTLKKHFSKVQYIPCHAAETVNLCYKLSGGSKPAFSAVWESCRNMSAFYGGDDVLCYAEFLFGIMEMFSTNCSYPIGQYNHFKGHFMDPGTGVPFPGVSPEYLPERLQDRVLKNAVEAGNIPLVIYLLDSCARPGKKLQNVTHMLLNRKNYSGVMLLHEQKGVLNGISPDVLRSHHLRGRTSDIAGKSAFNHYYFGICDHKTVWLALHNSGLYEGLRDALDSGVSPDHYIFRSYYSSFTLREYLSFLIEILDEVKKMAYTPSGKSKSFQLFQDIAAAEVFRDFTQA